MEPELIIKSNPIDFELTELLGGKPADFIVLCFNGEQLEFFGTPYDTPENRKTQQTLADKLNDRVNGSWWMKMFYSWHPEICKQFGLSPETSDKDFRPVVSCKISRVCHGYSAHLHCAIGLFETLAEKIDHWHIQKFNDGENLVEITAKNGETFSNSGKELPLVIAQVMLMFLRYHPTAA